MKKIIGIIVVIVLIGLIWWQGSKNEPEVVVDSEPIKVGVIIPMSGETASMGESVKNAIDLADTGNIEVIFEDDQCDSKKALSAYQKLKLAEVKVFYAACSGSVLALAPLAAQNGDLILTAYAGSAEIRNTGTEVIRFIPDALSVGEAMADYVRALSGKKVGLLYEEQDYAKSLADLLQKNLGESIVLTERYTAKDTAFRTQLTKLKAEALDYLLFIPTSDKAAQLIYKEMDTLNFRPQVVGEVNVCDYPFKPSDYKLQGVCWKSVLETAGYEKYLTDYQAAYGKESQYPFYDSITYDIFLVLNGPDFNRLSVADLKAELLVGVDGVVSNYRFSPTGEVEAGEYLKLTNY